MFVKIGLLIQIRELFKFTLLVVHFKTHTNSIYPLNIITYQ